jgi:hypothetical protein
MENSISDIKTIREHIVRNEKSLFKKLEIIKSIHIETETLGGSILTKNRM